MATLPATSAEGVVDQPARVQLEAFLDEHRRAIHDCLDGLTEEQARRSLVPSRTTLLHVLRELAQHCGHADILREQVLAGDPDRSSSANGPVTISPAGS